MLKRMTPAEWLIVGLLVLIVGRIERSWILTIGGFAIAAYQLLMKR